MKQEHTEIDLNGIYDQGQPNLWDGHCDVSDEVSDVSGADIESRIMPTSPTYAVKEELKVNYESSVNIVTGRNKLKQAMFTL